MNWSLERRWLVLAAGLFLGLFFLPMPSFGWLTDLPLGHALYEGVALVHDYAREHVILCLLPAFLIAGGMSVFVAQGAVLRHLGADAPKVLALGVASVSGTVLAVCSCTVLPLFAGLYKRGAGIGPAVAFLYTGPAINVIAIVMTTKILGVELGIARAIGAIAFAFVIGLAMHLIYRNEVRDAGGFAALPASDGGTGRIVLVFAAMLGVLVFANWAEAGAEGVGFWNAVHGLKWWLAAGFGLLLGMVLVTGFGWAVRPLVLVGAAVAATAVAAPGAPQFAFVVGLAGLVVAAWQSGDDGQDWMTESWSFAKQILPLLLAGVFVAGMLLGRPGHEGLIPGTWVAALVGGESLMANAVASMAGALMYFATLTEVPIVEGLRASGMGEGPSLALLLAGPALSLPNMLVIRSVIGTEKTLVYCGLVVVGATLSGLVYGNLII
ncbi:MAG: permease [Pseudomonadota bacterium]